ncbi:hypothetical protein AAVH_14915 [Aphelenchoides avenae]|nr:hypothetical protein AAVH_14915 [Aphelenchus avenae]
MVKIICFLENDDRRSRRVKKTVPTKYHLRRVNGTWDYVYAHYFIHDSPPPMDYLRSLELALSLANDLDNDPMRTLLKHGKSLIFERDRPRLIVPAIIEAFQQLKEEPSFLDVTLSNSFRSWTGDMALEAVWPQAYIDYVPWTSIEGPGSEANEGKPLEEENTQRSSGAHLASSLLDYDDAGYVVETFHIPSKHFFKQLVVELYFSLHMDAPWYPAPLRAASAPEFE